jgi:hypothetical protein
VKARFSIAFLFLLISLIGRSQNIHDLDISSDSLVYNIQASLSNVKNAAVGNDFVISWEQISQDHHQKIRNQLKSMIDKGISLDPVLINYFTMLNLGIQKEGLDPSKLNDLLSLTGRVIDQHTDNLNTFFISLQEFFTNRALHKEKAHQWLVFNDRYSFVYKEDFVAEVTPEEDMNDSWEDSGTATENYRQDEDDEDLWKEEEEAWDDWDTTPEDQQSYDESEDEQMLYAMGAVSTVTERIGPSIVFETLDLNLVTRHDSIFIKNASGSFHLIHKEFVGNGGELNWEAAGLKDVTASLEASYAIDPMKSSFSADGVKLKYPEKLEGEIEGILNYKSVKRDTAINNPYPRFMSYKNNIDVKGFSDKVVYKGGFTLKGQKLSSASVIGGLNKIVLKNDGNIKATSFSNLYVLEDSSIYSDMASIFLIHGYDSIHHPAVRIRFNYKTNELIVQEAKNGFKDTPYTSTYFSLNFQADMLQWDLGKDSLNISISQGRNIVPAKFESVDHYSEEDYRSLGDKYYSFNPLAMVVFYSNEYKTDEFYISDLAKHYKKDENVLHGAMEMLMQKGLIGYDLSTRLIEVTSKAKHLYKSRYRQTDYDDIIISSVTENEPNATIDFNQGFIRIRGVKDFLISDSLFVKIEPENAEVVMYENRDFSFDGKITAGNFEYIGRDFTFNYDSFLIRLKSIDSVRFYIKEENSRGLNSRNKVNNALVGLDSATATSAGLLGSANKTSGTLYINTPGNKSGIIETPNYPKFAAGEGAVVYFDRKNILEGLYKRDIYFVIPPFDIDSLNDSDPASIGFDGVFVSKGMLPNIEERLHYIGNNAMGFEHEIPAGGYPLYDGQGKVYGDMELGINGLRTKGRVEFMSAEFDAEDILLHPDSLVAKGSMAGISNTESNGIMFPQASLEDFKVKWLPREDKMLFKNTDKPFTFYNGAAKFEGEVMVRSDGVYGDGKVGIKGSRASSKEMKFEDYRFLARNADFEVETNNPEKPALAGHKVRVLFNLKDNYAEISPEIEGQAALDFPYAQFKTSITKAKWDLDSGTITMTKPEDVPLSSSYFYTTRKELDSLSFNATQAIYDIKSQELTVRGIPHIKIADALITPENNEVLIHENSRIGRLTNTTIILDTLHKYHMLTDGVIDIISRNEFSGHATYQYINASQDTFSIKMEDFHLEHEGGKKKAEGPLHTVANGSVSAQDGVIVSPGMYYKGNMILYAHKPAMELEGYIKLNRTTIPDYDTWIKYSSNADRQEVKISFDEAVTEDGRKLEAGLLFNMSNNNLYGTFVSEKEGLDDEYFFTPSGILYYHPQSESFVIEDTAKAAGNKYEGKHYAFQESSGKVTFEGPVSFVKNTKDVEVKASVIGEGNVNEETYSLNSLLTFNFNIPSSAYQMMAADLIDVITNLGAPEGRGDQTQLLYKLSNIIGERATREFESASLQEFVPLGEFVNEISQPLVFADVDLKWSPEHNGFYSEGMLGMSNISRNELNAAFEGFIELKKNDEGGPVINIFVKASAASWYYFGLEENSLLIHSSNKAFNEFINKKSNAGKAKFNELSFISGTNAEVLDFINRFRSQYYGINDPYILDAASDVVEEQMEEKTTTEEEDDGFEGDDGF